MQVIYYQACDNDDYIKSYNSLVCSYISLSDHNIKHFKRISYYNYIAMYIHSQMYPVMWLTHLYGLHSCVYGPANI